MEKVVENINGSSETHKENQPYTAKDVSTTKYNICDLYDLVKRYDQEFRPLDRFYAYVVTTENTHWEDVREQALPVVRWLMDNTVRTQQRSEYAPNGRKLEIRGEGNRFAFAPVGSK